LQLISARLSWLVGSISTRCRMALLPVESGLDQCHQLAPLSTLLCQLSEIHLQNTPHLPIYLRLHPRLQAPSPLPASRHPTHRPPRISFSDHTFPSSRNRFALLPTSIPDLQTSVSPCV
jgi:hypothetical protein